MRVCLMASPTVARALLCPRRKGTRAPADRRRRRPSTACIPAACDPAQRAVGTGRAQRARPWGGPLARSRGRIRAAHGARHGSDRRSPAPSLRPGAAVRTRKIHGCAGAGAAPGGSLPGLPLGNGGPHHRGGHRAPAGCGVDGCVAGRPAALGRPYRLCRRGPVVARRRRHPPGADCMAPSPPAAGRHTCVASMSASAYNG